MRNRNYGFGYIPSILVLGPLGNTTHFGVSIKTTNRSMKGQAPKQTWYLSTAAMTIPNTKDAPQYISGYIRLLEGLVRAAWSLDKNPAPASTSAKKPTLWAHISYYLEAQWT